MPSRAKQLKSNYKETAKLYGGGLGYWPIRNHMSQGNGHAIAL
jgi:hypothetical protein